MDCQRVRSSPMPKPDRVLRSRPLAEVGDAVQKLKKVVLFHPSPIVVELAPKYCVCGKGEHLKNSKSDRMVQCVQCYEWFHFDCVSLKHNAKVDNLRWQCEWCLSVTDKTGRQKWVSGRRKAKYRHQNDRPRVKGSVLGGNPPKRYSSPPTWEGKVEEVRELARRAAVKKKKLTEAVEKLVEEGGRHLVDAEGMAGLELRHVDDALIDELEGAGAVVDSDKEEGDADDS